MPAPVSKVVPSLPEKKTKVTVNTTGVTPRKPRVVKRRGRNRSGAFESDDEIERVAMSDESDSDAHSLLDSDSEPESASSGPLRDHHYPIQTPDTTQSPPPAVQSEALSIVDGDTAVVDPHTPAFLSAGENWSEMVSDEMLNGKAALPVIDFSDMRIDDGSSRQQSRSPPIPTDVTSHATPSAKDDGPRETDLSSQRSQESLSRSVSTRPSRPAPSRPPGQTARQAYQQRLQNDPSFTPVVGEFWGHDDRLMQKELRSLSPWWRGRWQGRGRGFGPRGRGRGGYMGESSLQQSGPNTAEAVHSPEHPASARDVLPIEKAWTHDGFEEMKARETTRQLSHHSRASESQQQTGFARGGRASMRGRGDSFSPIGRGRGLPFAPHLRTKGDRPWYAKKPDRMWTKQHEGFLHPDPASKLPPGHSPIYRVRLPGGMPMTIKGTPAPSEIQPKPALLQQAVFQNIAVNLPQPSGKLRASVAPNSSATGALQESVTTMEEPPIELTTSMTSATVPERRDITMASSGKSGNQNTSDVLTGPTPVPLSEQADSLSSNRGDAVGLPATRIPDFTAPAAQSINLDSQNERPVISQLPPLETELSPSAVNPVSPSAYSPFNYPLPPGIALSQQGFPYELATGRPVYLHHTPPPPMPLYNPSPISHSRALHHAPPFIPGHLHHQSSISGMSPEFHPQSHTPPFTDPTAGLPLFSLPRQSTRVEIRAPSEDGKGLKVERRPSGLRSAVSAEPFRPTHSFQSSHSQPSEYFPDASGLPPTAYQAASSDGQEELNMAQQAIDPNAMGYPVYPMQYYYPDHYAYPPYVDMSQPSMQFDPYPSDPRHQQQASVYY